MRITILAVLIGLAGFGCDAGECQDPSGSLAYTITAKSSECPEVKPGDSMTEILSAESLGGSSKCEVSITGDADSCEMRIERTCASGSVTISAVAWNTDGTSARGEAVVSAVTADGGRCIIVAAVSYEQVQ